MTFAPVYGRLAPNPEATHPRAKLTGHLDLASMQVPEVVDWSAKVTSWPEYYNQAIGDCTCAGIGHMIQAWTANAGTEVTLPDTDILSMYCTLSGYNPSTGSNDNGCVEQNVLQWMHDTGVAGHKVDAFAQVNPGSLDEMKAALLVSGALYLGINCPQTAETQAAANQPWTYIPGSPIAGGHCVVAVKWDTEYIWVVSWGKLIPMTQEFWQQYGEEAWIVISPDWFNAQEDTPAGLNLAGLMSEFHAISGVPLSSPRHAKPHVRLFWRFLNWLRQL